MATARSPRTATATMCNAHPTHPSSKPAATHHPTHLPLQPASRRLPQQPPPEQPAGEHCITPTHLLLLLAVPIDAGAVLRANVATLAVLLLGAGQVGGGGQADSHVGSFTQHGSSKCARSMATGGCKCRHCWLRSVPSTAQLIGIAPRQGRAFAKVHQLHTATTTLQPPAITASPAAFNPSAHPTCFGSILARNVSHSWSKETSDGLYVSCTASECPVRPLHTCVQREAQAARPVRLQHRKQKSTQQHVGSV